MCAAAIGLNQDFQDFRINYNVFGLREGLLLNGAFIPKLFAAALRSGEKDDKK
jgi:hypothetical protein